MWRKVVLAVGWDTIPEVLQLAIDHYLSYQHQSATVERIFSQRDRLERLGGCYTNRGPELMRDLLEIAVDGDPPKTLKMLEKNACLLLFSHWQLLGVRAVLNA